MYFGNDDFAFFKLGPIATPCGGTSVFGILACGMTLVIVTGGIDLAVGSVLALVTMCFSLMLSIGLVAWLAMPACSCGGGGLRRRLGDVAAASGSSRSSPRWP